MFHEAVIGKDQVPFDVYSPASTTKVGSIVKTLKGKREQANNFIVHLEPDSPIKIADLKNIIGRVRGAGNPVNEIVVIKNGEVFFHAHHSSISPNFRP